MANLECGTEWSRLAHWIMKFVQKALTLDKNAEYTVDKCYKKLGVTSKYTGKNY